jgi:hypothetical protein
MYKFGRNKSLLSPVTKIFKIYLPPFASKFNLTVPRNFVTASHEKPSHATQKRFFYFSELELTPSYFNIEEDIRQKEAGQKKEETEVEVEFQLMYSVAPEYYAKECMLFRYKPVTHSHLVRRINEYFDSKESGILKAPFYIDWMLTDLALTGTTSVEDYFETLATELYDDVTSKQDVALTGHSMIDNYELNRYVFPNKKEVSTNPDLLKDFVFRLVISPKCIVRFSDKELLLYLGFTKEQLKAEFLTDEDGKSYIIRNPTHEIMYVTAAGSPTPMKTAQKFSTKIKSTFIESPFLSRAVRFTMLMSEFNSNAELARQVQTELFKLARENNIDLLLFYDESTFLYKFTFPLSELVTVIFTCPEHLSQRLGYGVSQAITKKSVPEPQPGAQYKEISAMERSKTLCLDTCSVVVVLESENSNKTEGTQATLMASLRPTEIGTMKRTFRDFHEYLVDLNNPCMTSDDDVSLRFKLFKRSDKDRYKDLNWSTGCFISGCIEGLDSNIFD